MFGLVKITPMLDEGTTQWLFDAYGWALRNFGSDMFYQDTQLVLPNDTFFPDKVGTPEEMLVKLFDRVRGYAGMQAWSCELIPSTLDAEQPVATVTGAPRGPACEVDAGEGQRNIPIRFDPQHIRNPPALIAMYAQQLADHLSRVVAEPPPGGEEVRSHAADLLAVFMGFGVFLTNNAFTLSKGGGCSGCGVSVQCMGALTEEEFTFALAIYCVLKGVARGEVEGLLKSTLRSVFRKAVKEIEQLHGDEIARLRQIDSPIK